MSDIIEQLKGVIDYVRRGRDASPGSADIAQAAIREIEALRAQNADLAGKFEELKEAYEIADARLNGLHEHVYKIDEQSQVVAGVLGDAVVAELRRLIEDMQGDNPPTPEEIEERRRILEEIRRE